MKKFIWPLQKVLDVRETQEQKLRSQLFELTEEVLKVKQRIMLCEMKIKQAIADICQLDLQNRMAMQPVMLEFEKATKKEIGKHKKQLAELESKREEKKQETIAMRKMRKGLEKLKENAREEYMAEQNRLEQVETDDIVNTAQARKTFGVIYS